MARSNSSALNCVAVKIIKYCFSLEFNFTLEKIPNENFVLNIFKEVMQDENCRKFHSQHFR